MLSVTTLRGPATGDAESLRSALRWIGDADPSFDIIIGRGDTVITPLKIVVIPANKHGWLAEILARWGERVPIKPASGELIARIASAALRGWPVANATIGTAGELQDKIRTALAAAELATRYETPPGTPLAPPSLAVASKAKTAVVIGGALAFSVGLGLLFARLGEEG